jgi:regulatory protein
VQLFPLGWGVWHKSGVNSRKRARRALPPLNQRTLDELALRYVGKYATTRAKLRSYLSRKLRERGWDGEREADLRQLADRFAAQGYIDDKAYALGKSAALTGRGYGKRRVLETLRAAGVEEDDGAPARDHADAEAVSAALRFAERRRLGPFARSAVRDPKEREKALAAMIRAGHGFALARAILALAPGADFDPDELAESARITAA